MDTEDYNDDELNDAMAASLNMVRRMSSLRTVDNSDFVNSQFDSDRYLKSVPLFKNKIDYSRVYFFRLGHNPVYSTTKMVFAGFAQGGEQQIWADVENPNERVTLKLNFTKELTEALKNPAITTEIMQAGWIIRDDHRYGFLLNLDSIAEAY
jgi:hypothetical protein